MENQFERLGKAVQDQQHSNNQVVTTQYQSTEVDTVEAGREAIQDVDRLSHMVIAEFSKLGSETTAMLYQTTDDLEVELSEQEKADGKANLVSIATAVDNLDETQAKELADWSNASTTSLNNVKSALGTTQNFLANFNPEYGETNIEGAQQAIFQNIESLLSDDKMEMRKVAG